MEAKLLFTRTINGQKTKEYLEGGELPYPFTGLEEVVKSAQGVNFAITIENEAYQLQTVNLVAVPTIRMQ